MVSPDRPYHYKFFVGCLPQMLPGPFLNTLTRFSHFAPRLPDKSRFLFIDYIQTTVYRTQEL